MTPADQPLYDIIFRGDILPGQQLSEVKERLARLFKTDAGKINALFSGAAVPLKRNLDQATAEKYRIVLNQAGAEVQVAEAGRVQARPAPVRKAPVREAVVNEALVNEVPAMTLQQRLAAQEAERTRHDDAQAQQAAAQQEQPRFTLAPVGADLLEGVEKVAPEPVRVDVSNISLRPAGENLVDVGELSAPEPVVVRVEDYGLSEPGADLLQEHEKNTLPLVGMELPDLDLAPVGSDLGQLKDAPPPPPPDTAGLSLVPALD